MNLPLIRASSPGGSVATWLLAALVSLNAPVAALAQASQATPSQAPTGQAPQSTAPAPAPKTAAPNPQSLDGKRFQDWTLQCKTVSAAKSEVCEMQQAIVNQQNKRVMLAVVGRVRNSDTPGMLILLPLGIALPPGVFLKVDDGERRRIDLKICEKQGCHVEVLLEPDLLAQLKAGNKAVISFYVYDRQGKEKEVNIPISLLGFSAALAEVMKSPS